MHYSMGVISWGLGGPQPPNNTFLGFHTPLTERYNHGFFYVSQSVIYYGNVR